MTDPNPNSIDDAFPDDKAGYAWTALVECVQCGDGGRMHSTAEPRDEHVYECETCGEATVHEVVMKSSDGEVPER